MKTIFLSLLALILFLPTISVTKTALFRDHQKQFSRVREAYFEKNEVIRNLLQTNHINPSSFSIFLRVFKKEGQLELWAQSGPNTFRMLRTYAICAPSGNLGPKRRQGDGQVPEGFYEIDRFNPASNFHLALGLNYPNRSDQILGGRDNLGGDIFIHGNCVTVGCIPLTDDKIKEIYVIAVEAKNFGQSSVPVHIFPCRMDKACVQFLEGEFKGDEKLLRFWKNLKEGYDFFQKHKMLPRITVREDGSYSFHR